MLTSKHGGDVDPDDKTLLASAPLERLRSGGGSDLETPRQSRRLRLQGGALRRLESRGRLVLRRTALGSRSAFKRRRSGFYKAVLATPALSVEARVPRRWPGF
ncbi:hypothetical protein M6B38_222620 [Iris pallida]|uniref:Uncharacterized protein n=1 Tax=Iris pallida TaxID=29817 RepID=A0AAX6DWS8_IRIPA|nr:hypothetical protein M6B38_222620 [Iris pallida]